MNKNLTCTPSSDECIFDKNDKKKLKEILDEAQEAINGWRNGSDTSKHQAFQISLKLDNEFGYSLSNGDRTPEGFEQSIAEITCIELHNHGKDST